MYGKGKNSKSACIISNYPNFGNLTHKKRKALQKIFYLKYNERLNFKYNLSLIFIEVVIIIRLDTPTTDKLKLNLKHFFNKYIQLNIFLSK